MKSRLPCNWTAPADTAADEVTASTWEAWVQTPLSARPGPSADTAVSDVNPCGHPGCGVPRWRLHTRGDDRTDIDQTDTYQVPQHFTVIVGELVIEALERKRGIPDIPALHQFQCIAAALGTLDNVI